jgi:hypothetical protein
MSELLNNYNYNNCNYAHVPQKVNNMCIGNTCLDENELKIIKRIINKPINQIINKPIEHFGIIFEQYFSPSVLEYIGTNQKLIISLLNSKQIPTNPTSLTVIQLTNLGNNLLLMYPSLESLSSSIKLTNIQSTALKGLNSLLTTQILNLTNLTSSELLNLTLIQIYKITKLSFTQIKSISQSTLFAEYVNKLILLSSSQFDHLVKLNTNSLLLFVQILYILTPLQISKLTLSQITSLVNLTV